MAPAVPVPERYLPVRLIPFIFLKNSKKYLPIVGQYYYVVGSCG
jgi:hypothetical protein